MISTRFLLAAFVFVGLASPSAGSVHLTGAVFSDDSRPIVVTAEPMASRWQRKALLAAEIGLDVELLEEPAEREAVIVEPDEAGEYLLELSVGLWTVRLEQPGRSARCLAALPVIADRDLGAIRLEPASADAWRVEGAGGQALEAAYLLPADASQEAFEWSPCRTPRRTDESGELHLEAMEGEVVAAAPSLGPRRLPASQPSSVSLRPLGSDFSRLEVRDAGGPLEGVLALGEGRWPLAVSDEHGRLEVPRSARFDLLAPDGRSMEAVPASEPETIFEPPVAMAGRVVEYDGDLAVGVAGALVWSTEDPGLWTRADDEGRFSLAHLPLDLSESFPSVAFGFAASGYGAQKAVLAVGDADSEYRQELLNVELWLPRRPQTARYVGQVFDGDDEPLRDARVFAIPAGDVDARARIFAGAERTARHASSGTDVLGEFSLDVPVKENARWDVIVVAGERPPLVLAGLAGPEHGERRDLGSVIVPGGWRFTGRVVDDVGRAIEGARVEALFTVRFGEWSESFVDRLAVGAESNDAGRFSIAGRSPKGISGGFDLKVSKQGFRDATLRNIRGPSDAETELVLERIRTLHGRVTSTDGEPVQGALIFPGAVESRGDHDHGSFESLAITDADGRFKIGDFPAEASVLTVEAEGFATERRQIDAEQTSLEIVLEASAGLEGLVLSADGRPVEHAVIEAGASFTESGGDGSFELSGLRAGRYLVHAYHDDFGRDRQSVQLEAGSTRSLTLALESLLVARGRVVDRNRRPVPGALVSATDRLGMTSTEFADDDGRFRFLELDEGFYSVTAVATGFATSEPEELKLTASGADWLLVADPRGAIDGSLVGLDPDFGSVSVSWSCPRGPITRGEVFGDATFRLENLRLGRCWVVGQVSGTDLLAMERVTLTAEEPSASVELSFTDGTAFQGRVLLDGRPLDGAPVRLWTAGASVGSAMTDSRGRFGFSRVPEGTYRLAVEISGRLVFLAESVEVPSAATDWHVRTGALEVEVADPAGVRLPFARARIRPVDAPAAGHREAPCYDGLCRLTELSPGRYELTVGARGHGEQTLQIEITASKTARRSVSLNPELH